MNPQPIVTLKDLTRLMHRSTTFINNNITVMEDFPKPVNEKALKRSWWKKDVAEWYKEKTGCDAPADF